MPVKVKMIEMPVKLKKKGFEDQHHKLLLLKTTVESYLDILCLTRTLISWSCHKAIDDLILIHAKLEILRSFKNLCFYIVLDHLQIQTCSQKGKSFISIS